MGDGRGESGESSEVRERPSVCFALFYCDVDGAASSSRRNQPYAHQTVKFVSKE